MTIVSGDGGRDVVPTIVDIIDLNSGVDSISDADYIQSLADQYGNGSTDPNYNPCFRNCDGEPRICYYKLQAEFYTTMKPEACGGCPSVKEDCYLPQCVTADGTSKEIVTFNRMMPGPTIQVCEGDTVVVDMENKLRAGPTTIHWHGIRQMGTQYSDGAPYVTQCPIGLGGTFRYQFRTEVAGSFFYHSLIEFQKERGLSGPLIVRANPNNGDNLYYEDLPEHILYIQDWLHNYDVFHYEGNNADLPNPGIPSSYLINGRGIYVGTNITFNEIAAQVGSDNQPPVTTIDVEQGKTYRFRLISGTCIACAYSIFIQDHRLTIVSGDGGGYVVPTTVDTITSNSGERYEFLINATQPIGSYWIAISGAGECEGAKQLGILRYAGAPPIPAVDRIITASGPLIFNPAFSFCNGSTPDQLCLFQLQGVQPPPKELTLPTGYMRIPVIFGFYYYTLSAAASSNDWDEYLRVLNSGGAILKTTVNNRSYVAPPSPLISQYNDIHENYFCEPICIRCSCTYVVKIPLHSMIEMVIADSRSFETFLPTHPFHLHGYNFYVLEQGIYSSSDPVAGLQEVYRRLDNGEVNNPTAPMKDTVPVSPGGYAIVRFIADNPGFWMMYSHIMYYLRTGMAVVFQIGEISDLPPIPEGFPQCGDFAWEGSHWY